MRISDWSSDVCSSDLNEAKHQNEPAVPTVKALPLYFGRHICPPSLLRLAAAAIEQSGFHYSPVRRQGKLPLVSCLFKFGRSEEHTSELQSLMRTSYAVFCLKTKTTKTNEQSSCAHPTSITPSDYSLSSTSA